LPEGDGNVLKLVISVDGAGPTTYITVADNYKFPVKLLTDKGIAHFSFSKRGVEVTNEPPFYVINHEEYKTYFPLNSVEDIRNVIETLKSIKRLSTSRILLNGWSEGATITPLFASKYPDMVDALFLCGYSNINLIDLQTRQCAKIDGGGAMLYDCFIAIERKDNDWLINKMGATAEWFKGSYNLISNKELLPTLDLPVYIYHGASDGICDVQGVYDIKDKFIESGKANLTVNIFDKHGHGLEMSGLSEDSISIGMKSLLDEICMI
jgi:pimeloyl-ACP methyl ester carboxylesterase